MTTSGHASSFAPPPDRAADRPNLVGLSREELSAEMAEIGAHVRRYLDAGIDTAFLALSTLEQEPARRRDVLLGAVRALAPATHSSSRP